MVGKISLSSVFCLLSFVVLATGNRTIEHHSSDFASQSDLRSVDISEQSNSQLLSSYYAGRAIDISRTTAAHAFSYYMTSTYGVPHGEAVYMMFPYICRANGHEEYIRTVPELRTLDQFIAEKNLNRAELIDNLFENVNPARLGNNPCPVTKDHFCNL